MNATVIAGDAINVASHFGQDSDDDNTNTNNGLLSSDNESRISELTLGPGLIEDNLQQIRAVKSGRLHIKTLPNRMWIDNYQKRYIPAAGDCVIGVVQSRAGEAYRVDIGSAQQALLPWLSFEGATKRNRPNIKTGQLIYAQVCLADKHMEPELTCVSTRTNKADGFGELKGGFVWQCSLPMARCLLRQGSAVMSELAKHFPFETAIGLNGRVWINSELTDRTMLVIQALNEMTERGMVNASVHEIRKLVKTKLNSMEIDDEGN